MGFRVRGLGFRVWVWVQCQQPIGILIEAIVRDNACCYFQLYFAPTHAPSSRVIVRVWGSRLVYGYKPLKSEALFSKP